MSMNLAPQRLLERAVCRARRNYDYRLDPELGAMAATRLIAQKSACAARGLLQGMRLRSCGMPLFVGRRVIIRHPDMLSLGKGVVIDDGVIIEALSRRGVTIGDGTTIEKMALIRVTGVLSNLGEGLTIGSYCSVGAFSYLGAAGGISIGNNVLVGQRVSLHAENHIFDDAERPIREQGVSRRGIRIEDDCWIGSGVVILDGVTIGPGTVIGAGSIVTEDIPGGSVTVGAPARVIRRRGESD